MGVSGPGPQINAAALMGGMQPGAGNPNAHAMQHLSPAQAQMFHQQQMNQMYAANNPALQQQMQQQRLQALQQQQQARQALMAQAAAYQNMGSVPMGVPLAQMTPAAQAAHLAALGRRMPGQPMNHMLAQQIALQQQQMSQMGQQGPNANQHPLNPHLNIQQVQQAQLAAIQAQQAQHAAQAAQAAQASQAQQGPGQPQQPQPQQPQQPPGHGQQQGQPQNGPGANGPAPTPGPTQGSTPQPNPQQQLQAPPQTPQPNQAQQMQLAAHVQHPQAHSQHPAALAGLLQQRRDGVTLKGVYLLKLMQFSEHLSGFPGSRGKDDLEYWHNFVHRFFSQRGIFRHGILIRDGEDQGQEKQYEIAFPHLARYFSTHFDSGIKTMQLILDKGTTDRSLPNDCHIIENSKASLVSWFDDGTHVVTNGVLRVQFDSEQKFDLFEFLTTGHEEYISRRLVIQAARPAHNWVKEWHNLNQQDPKQSPEMSKKTKQRPAKVPPGPPPDLELPHSVVKSNMGITEAVYQYLEIVEIIGQMNPLFAYYHAHPGLAPYAALDQYVSQINASQPVMNGQPMPQGGGPRTPGFGQFQMGASPAMANSMLPGSPHIAGSPVPGQMAAPVMQLQASQQGTSSSGPSANTSPAQSNKRRRPSAVKAEEDAPASAPTPAPVGTPQLNGVQGKGKHPPTPRIPKRQKTGHNPA
ncbi:hypothetical protein VTK56DRAFT_751 [Thermocarpiscus australiensis]